MAAGFFVGVAGAVSGLAVASVGGVSAPAVPSAAAASPYRLTTSVVRRDVAVNSSAAQISCPLKTLRGGPAWVAVGGGVASGNGYAVGSTYPALDARGRAKVWSGSLRELPRFAALGGRPEQTVLTDVGNHGTFWHHRHHVYLPSPLLERRNPKGYSSVPMSVVCASVAPSTGPRLVTTVVSRDVPVDSGVAQIACPGASRAVGGGVVSSNGYAVGGSFPLLNSKGVPRGWSGILTELPRSTMLGGRPEQTVLTEVGNHGTFWHHRHHVYLPSPLLVGQSYKGYSSVRVYAVCATLQPAASPYRLTLSVATRDVPTNSGAAQIACAKGSNAVGGGVVGKTGFAVGSSLPVVDARGQATGWSGSLRELPKARPGGRLRVLTDVALRQSTIWHHRHGAYLPSSLLVGGVYRGYSSVRLYVVCASVGLGSSPLGGGTKTVVAPPKPPPPPATTTTAPPPPPPPTTTTTTAAPKLPDLVIRKFSLNTSTLTWNIVIRNDGDADAPASKTGLTQPKGTDERRIDTPPIKAGDSVTVTSQCEYGSVGEARARADAGNKIDEKDEDNNNASATGGLKGDDGVFRCRLP
jgi:hypothetical protein